MALWTEYAAHERGLHPLSLSLRLSIYFRRWSRGFNWLSNGYTEGCVLYECWYSNFTTDYNCQLFYESIFIRHFPCSLLAGIRVQKETASIYAHDNSSTLIPETNFQYLSTYNIYYLIILVFSYLLGNINLDNILSFCTIKHYIIMILFHWNSTKYNNFHYLLQPQVAIICIAALGKVEVLFIASDFKHCVCMNHLVISLLKAAITLSPFS